MAQSFIEEKGLQLIEGGDTGDFWACADVCGDHSFELYFTAGESGPSPAQIEKYRVLCERLDEVYSLISERYRSHLAGMDTGQRNKWQGVPVQISIVNVNAETADCDAEMICTASRGFLMFTRNLDFSVKIRDNRLVGFEVT